MGNAWFVCYLLACVVLIGFVIMASQVTGWRVYALVASGLVLSFVVSIAVPLYVVFYASSITS